MVWALLPITEDTGHARLHMIELVAVKDPVALLIGKKLDTALAHRRDVNGVFEGSIISLPVQQSEKMTVQMQGVVHHRVVNKIHSQDFSMGQMNGRVLL